jgi:tRNA A37 N6-isopentenylltransferase MiaA
MFVVTGPTASGKTALALRLAAQSGRRLVNADVFQFYRELKIISNREEVPAESLFFGHRSLSDAVPNAGEFVRGLKKAIQPEASKAFILVGCGLYVGATLYGLDEDRKKGTPFQGAPQVDYRMIVLNPDRAQLYERINQRVDQMMEGGALKEAQAIQGGVREGKIKKEHPALRAIGLKHLLDFLSLPTPGPSAEKQCIELWKRDTRRLAKRQWTWLRKFCAPASHRLWVSEANQAESFDF